MDGRKASELAQRPGCLGSLVRFWRRSYGGDYSILIFLVFAWVMVRLCEVDALPNTKQQLTGVSKLQLFVHPFHQLFSLDDSSIQYPFAVVERVPVCKAPHTAINSTSQSI